MTKRSILLLASAVTLFSVNSYGATPVVPTAVTVAPAPTPGAQLSAVLREHWDWYLSTRPELATTLGVREYDDAVTDMDLKARDEEARRAGAFLVRLRAIPETGLSAGDKATRAIMIRVLDEQITANGFGQRMMLFDTYSGWHQQFAGLADGMPFRTRADYQSYLDRLAQYPAVNRTALRITHQGLEKGYVLPCAVLGGVLPSITGLIPADGKQSRFYAPFARARPVDIDPTEWEVMQQQAASLIENTLRPELKLHAEYFETIYLPACRKTVGAAALPDGAAYYAFRVKQETTTDLTPDQIHQIGLDEVARIETEMAALATKAGYKSKAAFVKKLRTDPRYYAKSPGELMAQVALVNKTIDGKMPGLFGRLPRLPYGIREIPAETAAGTTTAYYAPGSPASGIAGTYYVNTSKLSQRPFWEVPALSAHESVPGHHHQIALQQELDLPEFRKNVVGFTAFVEGWGLYAERLGIEIGLYDTPEKDMGRLSYEMWRATRLVVDTGLHAKGWTKEQAVAFMTDHTALSAANIDAEVNRYISWPGQALGYKIGEMKIRSLRARAEQVLGPRFSLPGFHDAVLAQGPVPLDVLEQQIDQWIATVQARPAP